MSDIKKKIEEALAALRAAHPRARERTIHKIDASWAEVAAALARATGRTVTTCADGGAVPGAYRYRAEADWVQVTAHPSGEADVCAARIRARKVRGGDSGGWRAMWVDGGADLADAIKPHLPKGATRRESGDLKIDGGTADILRVVHALTGDYQAAAADLAADAARSAAIDAALGENLSW